MLEPFRGTFNSSQFSPARYQELRRRLDVRTRSSVSFRICETPCFFDPGLIEEMCSIGRLLTHQLIDSPDYMRLSDATIPALYRVPKDNPRPNFMTVDFGLVREADGKLRPKLVELQAFPSIFGYQDVLCEEYATVYGLDSALDFRLSGLDRRGYWDLLRRTIVGDHESENVVLLETDPEHQKTLPDFHVYEDVLGIRTVDIRKVQKRGSKLFHVVGSREVPIERVYNRAIVDELERTGARPGFDYRDDFDVEWAGHPNWYFRLSKFSLPHLDHESVPDAVFLDDWFRGKRKSLDDDPRNLLLKPLYSFAGKGIQFAPTEAELAAIPESDRPLYLVQERVHFAPVIATPEGMTQAEIRVMYVWPEDAPEMIAACSLVRLGRGLMMGVDHNRDQSWIGGSAAFFPVTRNGN